MFYSINGRATTVSEIASLVPRLLPMKKKGRNPGKVWQLQSCVFCSTVGSCAKSKQNVKAISHLAYVSRDANVITRFHKVLVWWHHSTVDSCSVCARDTLCGRLMHSLVERTLNVSITSPTQTWTSPSATVVCCFYKKSNPSPGLSLSYHTMYRVCYQHMFRSRKHYLS